MPYNRIKISFGVRKRGKKEIKIVNNSKRKRVFFSNNDFNKEPG
jgi:hypothetical protein